MNEHKQKPFRWIIAVELLISQNIFGANMQKQNGRMKRFLYSYYILLRYFLSLRKQTYTKAKKKMHRIDGSTAFTFPRCRETFEFDHATENQSVPCSALGAKFIAIRKAQFVQLKLR